MGWDGTVRWEIGCLQGLSGKDTVVQRTGEGVQVETAGVEGRQGSRTGRILGSSEEQGTYLRQLDVQPLGRMWVWPVLEGTGPAHEDRCHLL